MAASLAFHGELKRLLLDGKFSTGSDLMSALSAKWRNHPANPLRIPSVSADGPDATESRLGA